jgi:acetolactate synthase-1/2/3 large subunit
MWHFSPSVNFSAVAEAMGALGIRVTKPAEIRSALDRAISSGRPAVVEVMSDIEALAPNPWEP